MPAFIFISPTNRIQLARARSFLGLFVFAWLAVWSVAVSAQLPLARLFTVFPPGGKIGTTFEVSVSGTDLDEANQLHFSDTNLSARPKMGDGGQPMANTFIVSIASNAAPVVCEVRIAGRFGISNPRAFAAGDLPEIIEPSTNKTAEAASEVPLGTLVNGRVEANAMDYFKFSAKKGALGCSVLPRKPGRGRHAAGRASAGCLAPGQAIATARQR